MLCAAAMHVGIKGKKNDKTVPNYRYNFTVFQAGTSSQIKLAHTKQSNTSFIMNTSYVAHTDSEVIAVAGKTVRYTTAVHMTRPYCV